jgi:hypothetical protein
MSFTLSWWSLWRESRAAGFQRIRIEAGRIAESWLQPRAAG